MPRIRTIKPEFFQSESVAKLSRDARLLFLGLLTLADDEGRCRAATKLIAGALFPYDGDDDVQLWLDEIERAGMIRRYSSGGSHYLVVTGWTKHQKIAHATPSRLPCPPQDEGVKAPPRQEPGDSQAILRAIDGPSEDAGRASRGPHETFAKSSRGPHETFAPDLGSRIKDLGPPPTSQGSPVPGGADHPAAVASQPPAAPAGPDAVSSRRSDLLEIPEGEPPKRGAESRGSRLPDDWQPSAECRDFAEKLGLDTALVAESFRDYWHGKPGQAGRKSDWAATWRNWCRRDAEKLGTRTAAAKQPIRDRDGRYFAPRSPDEIASLPEPRVGSAEYQAWVRARQGFATVVEGVG